MPGHASAPPPRDCQTAFQKIATDCVQLIERNHTSATAADPEAIHAMRIELTRLRAAVRFFSSMVKDEAWSRISKELRWLNSALGNARDRDVTANYTRRKRYRSWAKGSRREVGREQEQAHRSLTRMLTSARYAQLIATLNHWLAKGPWLKHDQRLRSEPIDVYSQAILGDWRTEIWQKGQRLRTLRRKQLHRLRIRRKRYRYMLAALQSLQVSMPPQDLAFGEIATRAHRALGDLRDLDRLRKTAQRLPPHYRKNKRKLLEQADQAFRRAPEALRRTAPVKPSRRHR